jgi:hypothetical protein
MENDIIGLKSSGNLLYCELIDGSIIQINIEAKYMRITN